MTICLQISIVWDFLLNPFVPKESNSLPWRVYNMCIQDVYNDSQGASQTQTSLFSNMLQRIHRGWVNKLIQVSKAYIQLCVCIYVCLYIYMCVCVPLFEWLWSGSTSRECKGQWEKGFFEESGKEVIRWGNNRRNDWNSRLSRSSSYISFWLEGILGSHLVWLPPWSRTNLKTASCC